LLCKSYFAPFFHVFLGCFLEVGIGTGWTCSHYMIPGDVFGMALHLCFIVIVALAVWWLVESEEHALCGVCCEGSSH
jgi:hypothetical protein